MQHVLVHIDQSLGPIGAWSIKDDGTLVHFYPQSLDVAISGRARLLMAQRDEDVTVIEWMDFIADNDPTLLDEYQTFEVDDTLPLKNVLADFRRNWVLTDKGK